MLQKVLKVSNAEHNMFYEKEAGADLGTLERGYGPDGWIWLCHDNIKKL